MKTAVVFYSFSGNTSKLAQDVAAARNADLFEVKEAKKRGLLGAFFKGCPDAMKQRPSLLAGAPLDLSGYDRIVIAAPIWAGFPAPAFNSIVQMLPKNKDIELIFISGGGASDKCAEKVKALIEQTGSRVVSYKDIAVGTGNRQIAKRKTR